MADNVLEALGDLKKSKDDRAHNFVSLVMYHYAIGSRRPLTNALFLLVPWEGNDRTGQGG